MGGSAPRCDAASRLGASRDASARAVEQTVNAPRIPAQAGSQRPLLSAGPGPGVKTWVALPAAAPPAGSGAAGTIEVGPSLCDVAIALGGAGVLGRGASQGPSAGAGSLLPQPVPTGTTSSVAASPGAAAEAGLQGSVAGCSPASCLPIISVSRLQALQGQRPAFVLAVTFVRPEPALVPRTASNASNLDGWFGLMTSSTHETLESALKVRRCGTSRVRPRYSTAPGLHRSFVWTLDLREHRRPRTHGQLNDCLRCDMPALRLC